MKKLILLSIISLITHSSIAQTDTLKADFEVNIVDKPFFVITNTSKGATEYKWTLLNADSAYGTQDTVQLPEIAECYSELPCDSIGKWIGNIKCTNRGLNYINYRGEFFICLEASNEFEEKDTICKKIDQDFYSITGPYPNVFTPGNEDGVNDVFDIEIEGHTMYDLVIYNRWGVKVFESQDSEYDWNGKINNTGEGCPEGTYFWTLIYKLEGKDEAEISGTCTLIKVEGTKKKKKRGKKKK